MSRNSLIAIALRTALLATSAARAQGIVGGAEIGTSPSRHSRSSDHRFAPAAYGNPAWSSCTNIPWSMC
jgi:hypothetical protein